MAKSLGPELDRAALGKRRCPECDYELRLINGYSVCPHCGVIAKEAPKDYRQAEAMVREAFDVPPDPLPEANGQVQVPCGKWVPTTMQARFHMQRCRACKHAAQTALEL